MQQQLYTPTYILFGSGSLASWPMSDRDVDSPTAHTEIERNVMLA